MRVIEGVRGSVSDSIVEDNDRRLSDNTTTESIPEESTIQLNASDSGHRHPPEPFPATPESPLEPITCTYCDQSFTDRTQLISHMDKESSEAVAEYERKRTEGV